MGVGQDQDLNYIQIIILKKEVILLIESLNAKFNFTCSISVANESKSQYTIYIRSKNMAELRSLVKPQMLPSFYRKLGIK